MANYPPPFRHPPFASAIPQFTAANPPPNPGFPSFMQMANARNMNPFVGITPLMPHGSGFLHGAIGTTLNNPNMIDNSIGAIYNFFDLGAPVLHMLYDASIKGTEIDSKARHPPPRCHPGTRTSITRELYSWVKNDSRKWSLVWIVGFAGVGKTAVAQTVGEWAKEQVILGAAFFFSRTRNHTDPSRLFISIAYQLASQNEQYRHIVSQQLSTDFGLLEKDIRTQFKKLLIEPLSELKLDRKLLIIIDGLDECDGHDEQCEIINLVGGAVSSPVALPVVWMICSRPESHIKRMFFRADFKIKYLKKDVAIDDSETRKDIELFIRAGFKEVMEKFTAVQDDGSWPAAEDVEKVVSAASGLFVYASTIVKFVGDESYADPDSQLKAVIAFIEDSPAKSITENPLHYLDKLYEQILSDVHEKSLPLVLQLLATSTLYPALPILQLANLFGLSQARFDAVLYRLHSVVDVPPPDRASQDHIRVFHASFMDFLWNPARAGRFALNERDVHMNFAKACFGVLGQTQLRYAKNLAWSPNETPAFLLAYQILTYCAANVWSACTSLGNVGDTGVLNTIINFNYLFLRFVEDKLPVLHLYDFSLWLRRQIQQRNLENIIQPVNWKTDYLRETFGPCTLDSSGTDALRCFTLGKESKCITIMMSSDRIMLSRED